jgi:hypothetical protein
VVLEVGSGGSNPSADGGSSTGSGPASLDDLRAQFNGTGRYDGLAGAFTGGNGRFAAYRDPNLRIDGTASVPFRVAK